jgi:hypothetical protein
MKKTIRRLENVHVAFWLIKDYSWCTSTKWLALAMIGPTLAVAIYITYRTREHAEDCVHNAAICCWIAANVVWMIGEFYFADGTRTEARVFFWAGLLVLGGWYVAAGARRWLRSRPQRGE